MPHKGKVAGSFMREGDQPPTDLRGATKRRRMWRGRAFEVSHPLRRGGGKRSYGLVLMVYGLGVWSKGLRSMVHGFWFLVYSLGLWLRVEGFGLRV